MDISIKIPYQYIIKQRLDLNENEFKSKLIEFINQLENDFFLNKKLYNELIEYNINKEEFDKMIKEVELYATYDENPSEIGFPYEDWIDRLLEVYTDIREKNGSKR